MLFRPLVVLSVLSAALATPLKRADGLSISVTGPSSSVSSVDDLKFTATVTNNGAETVKVLKYGTILDDKLPTRSFTVTKDGQAVAFRGIKLSLSLEHADESAYAVIQPGESVTVNHEVASLFDFAAAGPGKFTFEPVTNFPIAESSESKVVSADELSKFKVTASPVEVEITGNVSNRELAQLNKRAVDRCTNASQKSFIDAGYSEAKSLARVASSYVSSRGAGDSLYQAYYGANSASTVAGVFNAVANENSSSRTLNCNDLLGACTSGVIAYTVTSTTNIYFCSIFYNEVATSRLCSGTSVASRNVRGGTILHELTHAVAGTDDVQYGCSADQALADRSQVINADNYNCFSTQVYANTQC